MIRLDSALPTDVPFASDRGRFKEFAFRIGISEHLFYETHRAEIGFRDILKKALWRVPLRGKEKGNLYSTTKRILWNLKWPEGIIDNKCRELTRRASKWIVVCYGLDYGHIGRDGHGLHYLPLHFGREYLLAGTTGDFVWNLKWFQTILDHKCKEPSTNGERWYIMVYGLKDGLRRSYHCNQSLQSKSPICHCCTMVMRYSLQPFTAMRSVHGARRQWCVWM